MRRIQETDISRAILEAYHRKLADHLVSDVIIVGAGPAGLTAARDLARQGFKVTILEKRLAPGGGIWGGGMGMNEIVIQDEALPIIEELGLRHAAWRDGLHTVDAVELASGLCLMSLHAGAAIFNLLTLEDVSVSSGRVTGVVANLTTISGQLHVDPIMFAARAVLDATGHDAVLVQHLRRRNLVPETTARRFGEGPMDATAGEAFVEEHVTEVFPGLWVAGMSVSATLGGPRMGPIFGGMLRSGRRAAERIAAALAHTD